MKYLAIGIETTNDLYTWSIEVGDESSQEICNLLTNAGYNDIKPEQILLIKNDTSSPSVHEHWNLGKEYN